MSINTMHDQILTAEKDKKKISRSVSKPADTTVMLIGELINEQC